MKHRLGDSTVELFYLSALIPADIAEQMPTTLFVTELAPVRLGTDRQHSSAFHLSLNQLLCFALQVCPLGEHVLSSSTSCDEL